MTILRAPGYEKNLKLFQAPARRCGNAECLEPMSKYNRKLFCNKCLANNPEWGKLRKLTCGNGHDLIKVGRTPQGVCKKCSESWATNKSSKPKVASFFLPALRRIKEESGKTWKEVWIGVGKPKNIFHRNLINYAQTRSNGEPKCRCPEALAIKLAEYFEVTLEELKGEK